MPSGTREHARLAALKRHRAPGDPEIAAAERDLRAAVLADHVRRVVAQAPPLTDDQRTRLALLLRPTNTPSEAVAS